MSTDKAPRTDTRKAPDAAVKALDRLIREFRDKLDGKSCKVKAPAWPEFKADGPHEVWGTIARQAGNAANADECRAAIENALTDFPEHAAEVWKRLESGPVPVVIRIDGTVGDDDAGLDPRRVPDSDMARGLVLLPHFIGKVRWVQEWKDNGWLHWTGKRWERNAAAVERLAKQILPREIAAIWGNYDAAAEAARKANVSNAMWWVRTHEAILTRLDDLDAVPWLLNLENGTLDLREMELRPHDPADMITKISPTAYDAAADCPLFKATLEKFVPDKDARAFLMLHFGSALTGIVTHLKLPILYGLGNNGKSTITNALVNTLGPDYATVLDADILTDDGSKGGKSDKLYHVAKLHGMRLVIVNELEENCTLRGPMLKALVSTDKLPARRPYEMPFEFSPTHKIAMLTNHKPRLRSTDNGTMRRLALVPFEVQIQPGEDDKHFGEKLKAEAAGILNLLIGGCKAWQSKGHDAPVPEVVAAATEAYRHEEDIIGRFVETCIKRIPGGFVTGKEVYETFKAWCDEAGIEPMTGTTFGRKFKAIFDTGRSSSSVRYTGIIINKDWKSND